MLNLRYYQSDAIQALYDYWNKGIGKYPLLELPTGAGKSVIIGRIIQDVCQSGDRVLNLTHVAELLEQNMSKAKLLSPRTDMGLFCAGLGKKQLYNQVVFASVQSIANKIHRGNPFDVVIIDECHLIGRNDQTRYGQTLGMLRKMNPNVRIVGTTATPYRLDSGLLYEGSTALFDGIAYSIPITELIEKGFLAPAVSKGGIRNIDLSGVHKRGGEFISGELARAASDPELVEEVADEVCLYGQNRHSWLLFACGINHAEMLKDAFRRRGVAAEVLTGDTDKGKRLDIQNRFKYGRLKCLINIETLTTGVDFPNLDLVAIVRATMSTSLFVQMVGRGLRTANQSYFATDKKDCLILDYGNNFCTHGTLDNLTPVNKNSKRNKGEGESEAPAKTCPNCRIVCHASARQCTDCGYEFPPPEFQHETKAYSGAIFEAQEKPTYGMLVFRPDFIKRENANGAYLQETAFVQTKEGKR